MLADITKALGPKELRRFRGQDDITGSIGSCRSCGNTFDREPISRAVLCSPCTSWLHTLDKVATAATLMYEEAGGEEDESSRSSVEAFREFYTIMAEVDADKWARPRQAFEKHWEGVDLSDLYD